MKKKLILFIVIITATYANAQPGTVDTSFNPGTGFNGSVYAITIQSDGKIIVGGQFTSYNGTTRNSIARLNTDGSLDTTFNPGTGTSNGNGAGSGLISTISIQSDGKIIIGGTFFTYNGTTRNHIARLNANGTLDTTFNVLIGVSGQVRNVSNQSDGKIIMGGWWWVTTQNGTTTNRLARLNTNGTLDAFFNQGTNSGVGATNPVISTSFQSDGKIVIIGDFTIYNGTAMNRIARLNTNGTVDTTFNPGNGPNYGINSLLIQSDGKIIIGGDFTSYNGNSIKRIARLNLDGTLDTTFNPGMGPNFSVVSTSLQSDGKIIVGGRFTSGTGTATNHISRLNSDGSLDTTFIAGLLSINGVGTLGVNTTSIQSDGKIIIGGQFTSYNGTARNNIIRINGGQSLDTPNFDKNKIVIYPNPTKDILNFSLSESISTTAYEIYNLLGEKVSYGDLNTYSISVSNLTNGVYIVKINTSEGVLTEKFIKE